jgi:bifunctional non-homologous end joining protein LigD
MNLSEYRRKRQLTKTPEPGPAPLRAKREQHLVFVVHKHAARRLHYDLRLEMAGVLKSFAVPKGPSLDPSVKRLAVKVEDHPFEYRNFEGVIPKGNYGAGRVIIWDSGFYGSPFTTNKEEAERLLLEGLEKGDLKFMLAGGKLKGEFALVRMHGDEKSWLLIKKNDRYVSTADILKQDRSVLSGKTVDELDGESPLKFSKRKPAVGAARKPVVATIDHAFVKPLRRKIDPMLPVAAKKPFNHAEWLFEVKWDGYRAIAILDGKNV